MYAISQLADEAQGRDEAATALKEDMYVDDLGSGADSTEELDSIIEDMRFILDGGGFANKFVCKSGEPPCEKASADGEVVKLLGYDWRPVEDTYALSFSNLDFSPKKSKKGPAEPISTQFDLITALEGIKFTKRSVLSKISAFYDPVGLFEPLKAQLKF